MAQGPFMLESPGVGRVGSGKLFNPNYWEWSPVICIFNQLPKWLYYVLRLKNQYSGKIDDQQG